MKKIYYFAVICIFAFSALGGTSYLFYEGLMQFALSNIALSGMAFPYVKNCFKKLSN